MRMILNSTKLSKLKYFIDFIFIVGHESSHRFFKKAQDDGNSEKSRTKRKIGCWVYAAQQNFHYIKAAGWTAGKVHTSHKVRWLL